MAQPVPETQPAQSTTSENPQTPSSEAAPPKRAGCSGCAWGTAGALGCLLVIVAPFAIALIVGITQLDDIVANIRAIFTRPPLISVSVVLDRVQALSQLTTVRYNYSGLVTVESDMPDLIKALYGQKQVLMAVGHINAGIDLGKITAQNVTLANGTLTLQLPPPVLQDCFLSEKDSYVVSQDTGLFARPAPELQGEARQYAVSQFRDSALKGGILDEVQGQSKKVIAQLVDAMNLQGVKQVNIVAAPPNPETTLPETCK
jgi:hypothetical protein